MTITERIEYDVLCLDAYFRQLFAMAQVASSQESTTASTREKSEYFIAHNVAAFIRPDMVVMSIVLSISGSRNFAVFTNVKATLSSVIKTLKARAISMRITSI